jgi:hypothetical protein
LKKKKMMFAGMKLLMRNNKKDRAMPIVHTTAVFVAATMTELMHLALDSIDYYKP